MPHLTGECDRNPVFMIGTPEAKGHCIRACGKCAEFYGAAPDADPRVADVGAVYEEAAGVVEAGEEAFGVVDEVVVEAAE